MPSRRAETYTWGVDIECFLPQSKVQEVGISIGSYHHGHPLPSPFPHVAKPEGPPWRSQSDLARWTAEQDESLHTGRRGYVAVEIVSLVLQGWAGSCRPGRRAARPWAGGRSEERPGEAN